MITITQNGGVVTLINVLSCDPQNQQQLIDSWIRATEERWVSFLRSFQPPGIAVRRKRAWSTRRNGRTPRTGEVFSAPVASPASAKMGKYAKPDAHLYVVC